MCPTLETNCPSPPPSWTTDVQPLVEKYCVTCHEPGGVGISSANLTTYADVFKNRTEMLTQVYQCLMPNVDASVPPPALPTAAERQTLVQWVVCGAPQN
jgi:hypothetical protein